jgi:cytidine deaminase
MRTIRYDELTLLQRSAVDNAAEALKNAYVPYSHYAVGACLIMVADELITGANVENAAYGSTLCAERAAVLRANAMGNRQFRGIAVIARVLQGNTQDVASPCGACRQVLFEMAQVANVDMEVILSSSNKDRIIVTTIKELLPHGFGPLDLGVDINNYRPSTP